MLKKFSVTDIDYAGQYIYTVENNTQVYFYINPKEFSITDIDFAGQYIYTVENNTQVYFYKTLPKYFTSVFLETFPKYRSDKFRIDLLLTDFLTGC